MRQLTTVFSNVESNSGVRVNRSSLRRASYLLVIAGLLTVAPAFAKEPADTEAESNRKPKTTRAKGGAEGETAIPCALDKLELSSQQQTDVKEIVRKHDAELVSVWKQFSDRYLETVAMEASMLAAIEDNLNEAQRKHVRDKRSKAARSGASEKNATSKSKTVAAESGDVVEEELLIIGVSLTPEQEASADMVHSNYFSHMRALKRDMEQLHNRLVSLEAEKIVQIEEVLTEGQLKQLRDVRKTSPVAQKATASKNSSKKTETKTE